MKKKMLLCFLVVATITGNFAMAQSIKSDSLTLDNLAWAGRDNIALAITKTLSDWGYRDVTIPPYSHYIEGTMPNGKYFRVFCYKLRGVIFYNMGDSIKMFIDYNYPHCPNGWAEKTTFMFDSLLVKDTGNSDCILTFAEGGYLKYQSWNSKGELTINKTCQTTKELKQTDPCPSYSVEDVASGIKNTLGSWGYARMFNWGYWNNYNTAITPNGTFFGASAQIVESIEIFFEDFVKVNSTFRWEYDPENPDRKDWEEPLGSITTFFFVEEVKKEEVGSWGSYGGHNKEKSFEPNIQDFYVSVHKSGQVDFKAWNRKKEVTLDMKIF